MLFHFIKKIFLSYYEIFEIMDFHSLYLNIYNEEYNKFLFSIEIIVLFFEFEYDKLK